MDRYIDGFTKGYIECALFCGLHDGEGEELNGPDFTIANIPDESLACMIAACERFQRENYEMLAQSGLSDDYAGHNFWLTRNRHGTGFWDREGPEDVLNELSVACEEWKEVYLYVADDGKVYLS